MKIKGFILHSRKEFVIENFGIDAWKKVLGALPSEDQRLYEGFIPTSDWYDFEIGKRVDEAIFNLLGEGSAEQFEAIGRKSARRHLTGIHASFVEPGDPQAFLKKADMIYEY